MTRLIALSLVLLAAGCSTPAPKDQSADQPADSRIFHRQDNLCMDDCLGHGGDRSFCEDRCTD